MTAAALERAWEAWEAKPGDTDIAERMEKACQAHATTARITATDLRVRLSQARREGAARAEAIGALR